MKKRIAAIGLLLCVLLPLPSVFAEVEIERVTVPLVLQGKTYSLDAMLYKPEGEGPFPALLLTHGTARKVADRKKVLADTYYVRNSTLFAEMDIVVLFLVRRGFGISDGPYAEYNRDENEQRNYALDGLEAAKDLAAGLEYLRQLPFVDKSKLVLAGQSTGGHSVLAAGSQSLPGVVGVINFAGGRGSVRSGEIRDEEKLIESFRVYGRNFRVPSLWLYSENDQYFGPELAVKFLAAFEANGARARMVWLPEFGEEGHASFLRARDNWLDSVLQFLQQTGILTSGLERGSRAA